jgi:hypothetical protein
MGDKNPKKMPKKAVKVVKKDITASADSTSTKKPK